MMSVEVSEGEHRNPKIKVFRITPVKTKLRLIILKVSCVSRLACFKYG